MPYQEDLQKLGLSRREAAVYQAALGIGPNSALRLSRAAKIPRATTYVVLESLMEKGLMTQQKNSKTTLFAPLPPRQLGRLLERQAEQLREYQRELKDLLPKLQAYMRKTDDTPTVDYYDGIEGVRAMRQEMVRQSSHDDTWYRLMPVDYLLDVFGEDDFLWEKQQQAKGIHSLTLFTTASAERRREIIAEGTPRSQRKFIDADDYQSGCGVTVYKDRVVLGIYRGKIHGVVIESSNVAQMMREVIDIVWDKTK